jgi:PEGA domain
MSAPYLAPSISVSSSGHTDGLGRRELCFDRETGAMLERLHVRPELAAFAAAIRDRAERLSMFEDLHFARTYTAERTPSGELTVVSEFVSGIRVADLLDSALEETVVPGVDAALGFLTESLSAADALHQNTGFPHGLIAADRTVFTAEGRLLFLDPAYAAVVDRLGLSRRRLWTDFGVAAAPGTGPARLDIAGDLSQAALVSVMLILGRKLEDADYPDNVPALLMEVVEVAQIRGSGAFAGGLQRLLQRLLPLPGRRPYASAEEALSDLRQLLRKEIGVDACQKALIEFIRQLHPAQPPSLPLSDDDLLDDDGAAVAFLEDQDAQSDDESIVEFDLDLDEHVERRPTNRQDDDDDDDVYELSSEDLNFGMLGVPGGTAAISIAPRARFAEQPAEPAATPENRVETAETAPLPTAAPYVETQPEPAPSETPAPVAVSSDWPVVEADNVAPQAESRDDLPPATVPESLEQPAAPALSDLAATVADEPADVATPPVELTPADEAPADVEAVLVAEAPPIDASAPTGEEAPSVETTVEKEPAAEPPPLEPIVEAATEVVVATPVSPSVEPRVEEAAPQPPSSKAGNHRRKRQQQKSARARKDKLQSTTSKSETVAQKPAAPPTPSVPESAQAPAAAPSKSGWLVPPDKTAKFETSRPELTPTFQPAQPPAFASNAAPPTFSPSQPIVAFQPPMAPPAAPPQVPALPIPGVQMPRFGAPTAARPQLAAAPTPAAPTPTPTLEPVTRIAPLKVKAEPPAGYVPTSKPRRPRRDVDQTLEPVMPLPGAFRGPSFQLEEPARRFPWKLAAAALVLVAAAILVGRAYLPGGSLNKAPVEAAPVTLPPAEPEPPSSTPPPDGIGQIVIKTEPAGAQVLLDGKAAGESPVTLDTTPGRHVLTFVSSSGSVKRTVKVVAGKSVSVEASIFSGWLSVLAPFVVDIAEDGQSLGTTEQGRLMLAPGSHHLVLTNQDLGYRVERDVTVTAAEVSSLRIEPTGQANFNAIPWAEVWADGRKIGDTPIANHTLPLGTQEFLFRHPQFGERKVTATIRAGQPSAVVVDFTKPQQP